jgi:hypothetical protein
MQLPIFNIASNALMMMQNKWKSILDPIISYPPNSGLILQNIKLNAGSNIINHKLGQKLQGWKIIRQRASASIYDDQDNNNMPDLTLILVSSAPTTIDLECF